MSWRTLKREGLRIEYKTPKGNGMAWELPKMQCDLRTLLDFIQVAEGKAAAGAGTIDREKLARELLDWNAHAGRHAESDLRAILDRFLPVNTEGER